MKGKARRLLSWVCVLALCMSLLPVTALASGTNGFAEHTYNDKTSAQAATGVTANKTVTDNTDGTYTVTLSVEGYTDSSTTTKDLPADIVLVVDTSTSMADEVGWKVCGCTEFTTDWRGRFKCTACKETYKDKPESCYNYISVNRLDVAKDAAKTFVNGLLDSSNDVRIGLYDFSGSNRTDVDLTNSRQTLIDKIEGLHMPGGGGDGTNYGLGLSGASDILENSSKDRQKFVVFLSDGEPTYGDGESEAAALKQDGVTIFTVGIDIGNEYGNAARALKKISSEDEKGNEYFYRASSDGSSGDALSDILAQIQKIIPSLINAGTSAVMTDVINTESFELVDPVEGLGHKNGTLTWNIGDITGTEETVSFTIKPKADNTATGAVHTNKDVTLSFDSTKTGTKVTFEKGAIGDPTVPLYSVTYTDGVDDETVFEDERTYNLRPGSETPAFEETPKREGYTFVGWSDGKTTYEAGQLPDTVSGNVTYTAQWKNNMAPTAHDIIIQVVLDGDTNNKKTGENVDDYISVTPKPDGTASDTWDVGTFHPEGENAGKVTYDITYYDCKDIGFAAKGGYVIEAIDADLVYGQSGCNGIYDTSTPPQSVSGDMTAYGDYMADNVQGGSTVTVYVRSAYTVEYYQDRAPLSGGFYDDTTQYVAETTALTPTTDTAQNPTDTGYYHVDCGCNNPEECEHKGYTNASGGQPETKYIKTFEQKDEITLPVLPTKDNHIVDGWWLDQSCTGEPNFEAGEKVSVSSVKPESGTIIKFYSESTPDTAAYTVEYVFLDENREEIADTGSWTSGDNFPKSGTADIGSTVSIEPPKNATGDNSDNYVRVSTNHTIEGISADVANNVITVTYALDNWKDSEDGDTETGGDGTPDYQQALIKYMVADGQKSYGFVTPGTQVETLQESEGTYTGSVTASSKATAEEGYAFDYWTDPNNEKSWNATLSDTFTAQGGQTYTYTANFAEDTNEDDIPDTYQVFVNFVSADEDRGEVSTKDDAEDNTGINQVYTLKDEDGHYVTKGDVTPSLAGVDVKAKEGFAFDIWTKNTKATETDTGVNPAETLKNIQGDTIITFYANFDTDEIGTKDPDKGDGIPDKHQATVTYNVVNGTFGENGSTTKSYVVTTDVYQTTGENAGTWTPLNKHVGDSECPIPENMTPDSSHVEPGAWGKPEPSNTVLLEGNRTYTYTYTFGTEVEKSLLVTKELTLVGGKEYNKSGIVDEGSELTYTITVTNTGNVTLTDIVVTDTLTINGVEDEVTLGYNGEDSNVTINKDGTATITSLDAKDSVKLTATYTVPEGTAGQKISNTAVATSGDTTGKPENPVEVTVANPSVEITKALTSATRPGDEGFNYDSTTYKAQVGDQLTYTITVNNTGNTHINVVVTDSLWGNGVNTVYIGGDTTGTSVADGDPVTIAMLPKEDSETITYTYTVQASDIGKQNISNTAIASTGTEEDDPKDEDTVTVPMDDYTVTITPANITIYTGGDGYSGVTDGDGNVIPGTETSGLPEPGYHIELPDAVVNWLAEQGIIASGSNADDVAANLSEYLTFTYDYNNQTRDWSMGYAGIYSTNETTGEPTRYVYTLNPAKVEDKEIPVRLLYKNGETVVSTDDILMSETLVSDQFSMTINPGELTQSQIRAKLTVEGQSISCNIDIQPGTLTVRSTTDKDTTTEIVNEQGDVTSNTITAVDGGEVQYYVNNSEVTVDADRVQLLVDEVSNGEEFNAAMGADAITRAGVDRENAAYDLAYMDLVDTQNGNTVVTMDEGDSLTIYWPVPENAAADSEFHVVHYTGMDRENTVDADKLSAQAADVKTGEDAVEKVTIGDQEQEYVKFTTSSFSPFALVYEKAPDPVASLDVTKTLTAVNGKTPGSSVSVGDTLTYTITVTNNGNVDLTNVTVTDTMSNGRTVTWVNLPDGVTNENGTLTITSLAAGTSVELTATYKVLRADASSNLVNTAKVTGTNPGDPGNPVTDEVQTPETPVNPYHPPIRPPVDPDKPELNTEDHYAYIVGYEDGSVQPEGDITRAEVATIFFRLLTDESRNEYWSQTNPYSDVSADDWYNNAVSTLTNAGVLDGYEDGTFKPNGNITRAEFATITARFFEATYDGENLFPDIEGHWAQDYINEAANAGIVNGYEDGTFRPQQYITRAEAVTMVNRTIERHPDADHLLDDMIVWPDNPETAWYYEQIQEATNSHEYTMNTDDEQNPYEIWTNLLPNRDWSELEKEWSDANDGAGSGEVV